MLCDECWTMYKCEFWVVMYYESETKISWKYLRCGAKEECYEWDGQEKEPM